MKKFLILLISAQLWAQTQTPNIGLVLPPPGSTNWNAPLNYNFNKLDSILGGTLPMSGLAWPPLPVFASGAPSGGCVALNEGQLYYDTSSTTLSSYVCHNLVWAAAGGGGGGGSVPAGNVNELQINNGTGGLGATNGLLWNAPTQTLYTLTGSIGANWLTTINGVNLAKGGGYTSTFSYDSSLGVLYPNYVVCMGSNSFVTICPTNTTFWNGIVNSVSSSLANVFVGGQANCIFDNNSSVGNIATVSTTLSGYCHDSGSSSPTGSVPVIGQILTANTGTGTTSSVFLLNSLGVQGATGPVGPPGGSLSYPGVTSDAANGLNITGGVSTGNQIVVGGAPIGNTVTIGPHGPVPANWTFDTYSPATALASIGGVPASGSLSLNRAQITAATASNIDSI